MVIRNGKDPARGFEDYAERMSAAGTASWDSVRLAHPRTRLSDLSFDHSLLLSRTPPADVDHRALIASAGSLEET
ncbi:protein of unknown function (plasmid) [Caballeronia sp. S22]